MLPEINQQNNKTTKKCKISDTSTSSINIMDDAGTHILSTPLSNGILAFADTNPPSIRHRQTRPIVLDKSSDISPNKLIFLPFLRGRSSSSRTTEIGTKKEYATSMARLRPRPALHVEENNNGDQEFHHVSHNRPAGPISFIDRAGGDCHQRQDQINLERPLTVKLHDSRDTSTTSSCSRQRSLWTPTVFSASSFENNILAFDERRNCDSK